MKAVCLKSIFLVPKSLKVLLPNEEGAIIVREYKQEWLVSFETNFRARFKTLCVDGDAGDSGSDSSPLVYLKITV